MSDTIDIDIIKSMLDSLHGESESDKHLDEKGEQTDASVHEETTCFDEDYIPPEWEEHPDFEGVMTRVVDAGWLMDNRELAGLTVQTYQGFEETCPIPVPPKFSVYEINVDQQRTNIISANTGLTACHVGHTGSGKTSGLEYFAAMTGRPFHRQECDEFTDDQKLFGSLELDGGKTYFNKSDLTKSLSYPAILCIDESNALTSTTQMALNPLLDRRQVRVTSYGDDVSETVQAHNEWMVACTSNTNGSTDDLDLYNSANVQDQAMINRVDLFVQVPYPSIDAEKRIIEAYAKEAGVHVIDAPSLAKFSSLCHKAFQERKLSTAFSIRNLKAIVSLLGNGMDVTEAITLNFTNRVTRDDADFVRTTVRSIW